MLIISSKALKMAYGSVLVSTEVFGVLRVDFLATLGGLVVLGNVDGDDNGVLILEGCTFGVDLGDEEVFDVEGLGVGGFASILTEDTLRERRYGENGGVVVEADMVGTKANV